MNSLVEDRWHHQNERSKLCSSFIDSINRGDFPLAATIADLVRIQARRPDPLHSKKYPQYVRCDVERVKMMLITLAVPQLRELNELISEAAPQKEVMNRAA
jgi:hypothetical protein